jgi:2-dehydropantoate 2-reductase
MIPTLINIIGPGNIGKLWAIRLSVKGYKVQLYGKTAFSKQSLEINGPKSSEKVELSCRTLSQWQEPSHIMICVKASALEGVCEWLARCTLTHPPIILMMNGLGLLEIASRVLPGTSIFQASTTIGAKSQNSNKNSFTEQPVLHYTGEGITLIGDIASKTLRQAPTDSLQSLIEAMNSALPQTRWSNEHYEALLNKVIINAVLNPLTAIHNVNNGQVIDNPTIKAEAERLVNELEPIIEKHLQGENLRSIFGKVKRVAQQTSNNVSSMRQDILAGRPTEIDFITGHLLGLAKKDNIVLVNHQRIFEQIKALEK